MSVEQPTEAEPQPEPPEPPTCAVLTPDELRRARGVRELIRRRVYTDEG